MQRIHWACGISAKRIAFATKLNIQLVSGLPGENYCFKGRAAIREDNAMNHVLSSLPVDRHSHRKRKAVTDTLTKWMQSFDAPGS